MRHVFAIAGRELYAYFFSPVAYVVLTLWAVLAGTFFLVSVMGFQDVLIQSQQFQDQEALARLNLNDHLISPFVQSLWIVLLFLLPAVTMGLFAAEKSNGTEELLLTSPVTIWEIVLGKFGAAAVFVLVMMGVACFFPALLFVYGDPEVGKTVASMLSLSLVSLAYMSVGAFASAVTRNQLIAFLLALTLLLVFGLMLPFIVQVGLGGSSGALAEVIRYASTGPHVEQMVQGLVDTQDLVYFFVVIGVFLLLSKTAVESVRWM